MLTKVTENRPLSPESIILYDLAGSEIKSWQALAEYAALHPPGPGGLPPIPGCYAEPAGRITRVKAFPLLFVPAVLAATLAGLAVWAIIRRRRRKQLAKRLTTD